MSYTLTANSIPDSTTNAAFRAWGQFISNAIANCGMTKTTATGQIDFTTVAAPGGATTSQGYEIWQFQDALQATSPFFFKIEYGSAGAAGRPGLWFTFGTSANSSGGITGANTPRITTVGNGSTPGANVLSWLSGDTNRLQFALWVATVNATILGGSGGGVGQPVANITAAQWFSVERTRNANGVTGDGIMFSCTVTGRSGGQQIFLGNTVVGSSTYEANLGPFTPSTFLLNNDPNAKTADQHGIFPFLYNNKSALVAGYDVLCMYDVLPVGDHLSQLVSVPCPDGNHTYVTLTSSVFNNIAPRGTAASSGLLLRYE